MSVSLRRQQPMFEFHGLLEHITSAIPNYTGDINEILAFLENPPQPSPISSDLQTTSSNSQSSSPKATSSASNPNSESNRSLVADSDETKNKTPATNAANASNTTEQTPGKNASTSDTPADQTLDTASKPVSNATNQTTDKNASKADTPVTQASETNSTSVSNVTTPSPTSNATNSSTSNSTNATAAKNETNGSTGLEAGANGTAASNESNATAASTGLNAAAGNGTAGPTGPEDPLVGAGGPGSEDPLLGAPGAEPDDPLVGAAGSKEKNITNNTVYPTGNSYLDQMMEWVLHGAPGYPFGHNVIFNNKTFVYDFFFPNNNRTNISAGVDGYLIIASRKTFPGLLSNIISMSVGFIGPCGLHTPHTHPRGSEIAFAAQGSFYTGRLAENGSPLIINFLRPGQMTAFPRGNIHWVANLECTPAMYVSAYADEDPGYLDIAFNFFRIPPEVTSPTLGYLDPFNIELLSHYMPYNFTVGLQECVARCGLF